MEIVNLNNPTERAAYADFVEHHPAGGFMQTLEWCNVKNGWDHEAVVSRDEEGKIVGSMLVLIKKLPVLGKTMIYAPRGPVCDLHDIALLKDLLEGAKAIGKKHHAYLFRMDPYITEDDDSFIAQMRSLGFRFKPGAGDNEPTQSRKNYMKNIANMTAAEVFDSFHSKWRYNIRLAQQKGVECTVCDKSHLDDFCGLMKVTGQRDGFEIRSKDYFAKMLDGLGDRCRLYMCYHEGTPLSGAIATQFSGKTCYVYGASGNEKRNLMPNYLMQWTMMQWAIENNNFLYDFQGIPGFEDETHPNYGVYRFKKGFNGQVVVFAGEFDYIFSKPAEQFVSLSIKAVHKLIKMRSSLQAKMAAEGTRQEKCAGKEKQQIGT